MNPVMGARAVFPLLLIGRRTIWNFRLRSRVFSPGSFQEGAMGRTAAAASPARGTLCRADVNGVASYQGPLGARIAL